MSDVVAAAIITVSGMVVVAGISAFIQIRMTKLVINSEHRKIAAQIQGESAARAREKRIDNLLEVIADLVTLIDPDSNQAIDIPRMNSLIHKAELLIDRSVEEEKYLNASLVRLGMFISGYEADSGPAKWLSPLNKKDSLRMLGQFTDQARAVFSRHNR